MPYQSIKVYFELFNNDINQGTLKSKQLAKTHVKEIYYWCLVNVINKINTGEIININHEQYESCIKFNIEYKLHKFKAHMQLLNYIFLAEEDDYLILGKFIISFSKCLRL